MIIFDASALVSAALKADSVPERALLRAEEVDVFALSAAVDGEIAGVLNRPSAIIVGMEGIYSDHSRLDERSLALHQLIAAKVLADPALLDKARDNLRRWQQMEGSPKPALAEWEQILSGSTDQIAQFLTERSERATRLRQSSPFAGVLSETERKAIYESFSIGTYHPRGEPNLG